MTSCKSHRTAKRKNQRGGSMVLHVLVQQPDQKESLKGVEEFPGIQKSINIYLFFVLVLRALENSKKK